MISLVKSGDIMIHPKGIGCLLRFGARLPYVLCLSLVDASVIKLYFRGLASRCGVVWGPASNRSCASGAGGAFAGGGPVGPFPLHAAFPCWVVSPTLVSPYVALQSGSERITRATAGKGRNLVPQNCVFFFGPTPLWTHVTPSADHLCHATTLTDCLIV